MLQQILDAFFRLSAQTKDETCLEEQLTANIVHFPYNPCLHIFIDVDNTETRLDFDVELTEKKTCWRISCSSYESATGFAKYTIMLFKW
jgi:hypothetical protein